MPRARRVVAAPSSNGAIDGDGRTRVPKPFATAMCIKPLVHQTSKREQALLNRIGTASDEQLDALWRFLTSNDTSESSLIVLARIFNVQAL